MTQEEYETALQDADVMVSNCIHAPTSYLEYFGNSHNVKDMLLAGDIIKKLFPEDTQAFEEVMHQDKYYFGNLCVMKRVCLMHTVIGFLQFFLKWKNI